MTQSGFWIISSINFACVLAVTLLDIWVTRQTTKKIDRLARTNSMELALYEKMVQQISEFLQAIDETQITLPSTTGALVLHDEKEREAVFSQLRKCRSDAEVAYYRLLLMFEYSRTDVQKIESAVKEIMREYRLMHEGLLHGMIENVQYDSIRGEGRKGADAILVSSAKHLRDHADIREKFVRSKDNFIAISREYMAGELRQIRRELGLK